MDTRSNRFKLGLTDAEIALYEEGEKWFKDNFPENFIDKFVDDVKKKILNIFLEEKNRCVAEIKRGGRKKGKTRKAGMKTTKTKTRKQRETTSATTELKQEPKEFEIPALQVIMKELKLTTWTDKLVSFGIHNTDMLLKLTDSDLQEVGMKTLHRTRLLKKLEYIRSQVLKNNSEKVDDEVSGSAVGVNFQEEDQEDEDEAPNFSEWLDTLKERAANTAPAPNTPAPPTHTTTSSSPDDPQYTLDAKETTLNLTDNLDDLGENTNSIPLSAENTNEAKQSDTEVKERKEEDSDDESYTDNSWFGRSCFRTTLVHRKLASRVGGASLTLTLLGLIGTLGKAGTNAGVNSFIGNRTDVELETFIGDAAESFGVDRRNFQQCNSTELAAQYNAPVSDAKYNMFGCTAVVSAVSYGVGAYTMGAGTWPTLQAGLGVCAYGTGIQYQSDTEQGKIIYKCQERVNYGWNKLISLLLQQHGIGIPGYGGSVPGFVVLLMISRYGYKFLKDHIFGNIVFFNDWLYNMLWQYEGSYTKGPFTPLKWFEHLFPISDWVPVGIHRPLDLEELSKMREELEQEVIRTRVNLRIDKLNLAIFNFCDERTGDWMAKEAGEIKDEMKHASTTKKEDFDSLVPSKPGQSRRKIERKPSLNMLKLLDEKKKMNCKFPFKREEKLVLVASAVTLYEKQFAIQDGNAEDFKVGEKARTLVVKMQMAYQGTNKEMFPEGMTPEAKDKVFKNHYVNWMLFLDPDRRENMEYEIKIEKMRGKILLGEIKDIATVNYYNNNITTKFLIYLDDLEIALGPQILYKTSIQIQTAKAAEKLANAGFYSDVSTLLSYFVSRVMSHNHNSSMLDQQRMYGAREVRNDMLVQGGTQFVQTVSNAGQLYRQARQQQQQDQPRVVPNSNVQRRAQAFATLGLRPGASPAEQRSAFRDLAPLYHTDRHPTRLILFQNLTAANEILNSGAGGVDGGAKRKRKVLKKSTKKKARKRRTRRKKRIKRKRRTRKKRIKRKRTRKN